MKVQELFRKRTGIDAEHFLWEVLKLLCTDLIEDELSTNQNSRTTVLDSEKDYDRVGVIEVCNKTMTIRRIY